MPDNYSTDAPESGKHQFDPLTVAAIRDRCWDHGWRPMPVLSWDHPDPVIAGKAPIGKDWGKRARQDPPECIKLGAVVKHALNTGILCDGLRAIDIDVDDPEKAKAVSELATDLLGDTIGRYRDNSSRRLLLYRATTGEPGKRAITGAAHTTEFGCKIEVLGHGQQFVAHGVHQSGAAIWWSPAGPDQTAIDDLPAVTEDAITAFLRAAAPLIGADPALVEQRTNGKLHEPGEPQADALLIAAALLDIPNDGPADWEAWNRVGMAVWAATGGNDMGCAAFDAWSRRSRAYDPNATRQRWDHYFTSPPTQIGAGTIFHMAAEARRARANGPGPPSPDEDPWPDVPPPGPPDAPPPDPRAIVDLLSIHAWTQRQIPEPDRLIGEVLTAGARMFLVGRTGLGKTLMAFAIACGIATGDGFLHWRCTKPKRVLLIDGEMPEGLIKARAIEAMRRIEGKPSPENLIIYSRYLEDEFTKLCPTIGKMPPLNAEPGWEWLLALIDAIGGVDVVIFDNVMSLIIGDQKDEVSWSGAMPLVQALTARNIAQLWLDHTGWNTDRQYGSSTKAWPFDSVGVMAQLKDDQCVAREVAFTVSFEFPGKARRRTPDNWSDFETCIIRLKDDRWTSEPVDKGADGKLGKVAPSRGPYYDALVAAIGKSTVGQGRTTLPTWELECLRRGLIHRPPDTADGKKETWQQRDARHKDYRKAKSDLIAAKWIAVDGELVIDLKARWK